jgi:Bacterial sugar transferase
LRPLYGSITGRTEWERGHACTLGRPAGGGVCMCGFAVARGGYHPPILRRAPGWARRYRRRAALVGFTCVIRFLARVSRHGSKCRIAYGEVLFTLRKGLRVTTMKGHLWRWPVEELPQLFNVFLGDTSLVGPQPALPDEAAKYAGHIRLPLVVKPGLSGSGGSPSDQICPGGTRSGSTRDTWITGRSPSICRLSEDLLSAAVRRSSAY